jgi:hypothetical protein
MNVLAVDLNTFAQRATLVDAAGSALEHYVSKPHESGQCWFGKIIRSVGPVTVVGSPLDEWPDGTTEAVRCNGSEIEWLNPILMRRLFMTCRPWNLHRKLHRARFLAYLYFSKATPWDADTATRDFEAKAARDLLESLGQ